MLEQSVESALPFVYNNAKTNELQTTNLLLPHTVNIQWNLLASLLNNLLQFWDNYVYNVLKTNHKNGDVLSRTECDLFIIVIEKRIYEQYDMYCHKN